MAVVLGVRSPSPDDEVVLTRVVMNGRAFGMPKPVFWSIPPFKSAAQWAEAPGDDVPILDLSMMRAAFSERGLELALGMVSRSFGVIQEHASVKERVEVQWTEVKSVISALSYMQALEVLSVLLHSVHLALLEPLMADDTGGSASSACDQQGSACDQQGSACDQALDVLLGPFTLDVLCVGSPPILIHPKLSDSMFCALLRSIVAFAEPGRRVKTLLLGGEQHARLVQPLLTRHVPDHLVLAVLALLPRAELYRRLDNGMTPLMLAAQAGRVAIIQELLARCQPGAMSRLVNARGCRDTTALLCAARHGSAADAVSALIRAGASVHAADVDGFTPLMRAAASGEVRAAAHLLRSGALPNQETLPHANSLTALMLADNADMASLLIAHGASVNLLTRWTPLMTAASHGRTDVISVLLAHGANIHATNAFGEDALINASIYSNGSAAVPALLRAGASPTRADSHGNTALMYAACSKPAEVVQALLDAGADVFARNRFSKSVIMFASENRVHNSGVAGVLRRAIEAADVHAGRMRKLERSYECWI